MPTIEVLSLYSCITFPIRTSLVSGESKSRRYELIYLCSQ